MEESGIPQPSDAPNEDGAVTCEAHEVTEEGIGLFGHPRTADVPPETVEGVEADEEEYGVGMSTH